jgi:[ribosomal protein S5]-alanine N-acetyltransferase
MYSRGVPIRPVQPEDAAELAALYRANREFLAPYEPVRPDDFFTADGQRERLERQRAEGTHPFAILDAGAIAGTINVFHIVRESLQSCAVGYWIDRARNGRGLATGALEDVVAYAFGELGLHRVEAATLLDNIASQRVLEKASFERIGVARRFLRINGEWRDFVLFQRVAD